MVLSHCGSLLLDPAALCQVQKKIACFRFSRGCLTASLEHRCPSNSQLCQYLQGFEGGQNSLFFSREAQSTGSVAGVRKLCSEGNPLSGRRLAGVSRAGGIGAPAHRSRVQPWRQPGGRHATSAAAGLASPASPARQRLDPTLAGLYLIGTV